MSFSRLVFALGLALGPIALAGAAPPAAGGAVASSDPHATRVGLEILAAGGSAADAAVATALVLAVTHPEAGNLAGGGFALVLADGEPFALDFREVAPSAAHWALFLDRQGEALPEASTLGPLSSGVPGTPDGLFELHRRFGRLPWRQVVRPAASIAERGFVLRPRLAEALEDAKRELGQFPSTAGTWLPDGAPLSAGTRLRLPELARTLRDYARRGPVAITEGRVARALIDASDRHGGVLSLADLAAYEARWREPIRFEAGSGWRVASMPLPSSGGIILAESAALLRAFAEPDPPGDAWARSHRLAEAWRRSFADRFAMGDPDQGASVEPQQLLDPRWMAARAASFDPARATTSAQLPPWPDEVLLESMGHSPESEETTHLSVVDAEGDAVSLTTTLNGSFGSSLWVPELGFLNNEMDDFTTAPGKPNLYGLIQGPANEVRPGARMLSSMSPTIAWRRDEVLALGSPGGSRIPTAVLQVLLSVLVDRRSLQDAVDARRIHHQWWPDRIDFEPEALDAATRAALEAMGHELNERPSHGEVHAVRRHASGRLEAAADLRGPGSAGQSPRVTKFSGGGPCP